MAVGVGIIAAAGDVANAVDDGGAWIANRACLLGDPKLILGFRLKSLLKPKTWSNLPRRYATLASMSAW